MASYDDIFAAPMEDTAPRQNLSKEEYAAKKKAERDAVYALADSTAAEVVSNGELFRIYLDLQAHFDRYSATNTLLIMAQNGDATQLRDYDGWADKGVQVQKKERGLSLLEPGDSYTTEDGKTGTYYDVKKVFDISQTNARHRQQPPVHYDERILLAALIAKRPVPIEMVDELNTGAIYDHDQGKIFVRRGMEAPDIFRSVSLALARAELAGQAETYQPEKAAFQSYCVSYMLGRKYGIDVSAYRFEPLPEFLRGAEPQEIRRELSEIRDTMNTMSGRMARALEQAKSPKERVR